MLALAVLTAIAGGAATWGVIQAGGLGAIPEKESAKFLTEADASEGLRKDELDKLNKALALIGDKYMLPANRQALIDGALQGMIESLGDPYSVYLSKEEAERFTDTTQGMFTGIGADLKKENGLIVVESPIKGSPADRAGLQPRDVLLAVNGESLQGLTLNEAAEKIRGPKGTKAKLKVLRPGFKEPIELELVRDRIPLETVKGELGPDGVGLLSISQFSPNTPQQVAAELEALETGGLKALIVDVRNNPGGMTDAVHKTADQFIPEGKVIVQYEYGDGRHVQEVAKGESGDKDGKPYPILVLINQASASSAEILAGALQQSAGAILVGEQSFGKGTVQISYPDELGDGSLVKLTVYKWLLPDGTWIQHEGLEPDVPVAQHAYWLAYKLPRDRVLKRDDTGEDVKNLQFILEGVGFSPGRTDGYFSESTEEALRAYQAREQLTVTGLADAATADRLEESLYAQLQDPANDNQLQTAIAKARSLIGLATGNGNREVGGYGRNTTASVEYVGGPA